MTHLKEKLTEEEIVGRVVKGEKGLYEIIVRRFNPYLYKIGRSYSYSHEITQDLMQDTFIDAYKSLSKFEGRSSFKTWIIRIMLNNCYRKSNKSSYKNEVQQDINDNLEPMYSDGNNETERIVRSHELKRIIEEALEKIPFEYRMVFSLREINEMKVKETAELLNISESNVKVRLSRAKTMLKNELISSYSPNELFDFNLVYCTPMVERVMKEINKLQ